MVSVAQLKDVPPAPAPRPDIAELRSRVAQIAPQIKARAHTTEKAGRVPEENIIALRNIGYFDIVKPAMFGGYEHDFDVLVELNIELAKSCASTAWVGGLLAAHQWLIAQDFPRRQARRLGQQSRRSGLRLLRASRQGDRGRRRLSPHRTLVVRQRLRQRAMVAVRGAAVEDERRPVAPAFLLVPASDYVIDDTWNVVGLSGTGSKTLVLNDVFVPAHRLLSFADTTSGKTPGAALYAANPTFSIPMLSNIPSCLASAAVGAAAGALEDYLAVTSRRITRGAVAGHNNRMADFPTIQLRVAEATASVDAAREVLLRDLQGSCSRDRRITGRSRSRIASSAAAARHSGRTCHSRHRSVERLDRRARPRPFQPGAARLARRQCRRPPYQHELGCRRHHVRPARARADAARTVLRPILIRHQRGRHAGQDRTRGTLRHPGHADGSAGFVPDSWPELKERLLDIQDKRLAQMDRHGVEMMILSLNAPAVQAIPDIARANEIAIRANDFLAEQVAKRPSRFQAFAALPMQDPDLAITELERCIKTLGFRGALVNGFSQIGDGKRPRSITTCRNTGRSGRRSKRPACPSTCTRAIRCRKIARSTKDIRG